MLFVQEPQIGVTDHVNVDERLDSLRGSIDGPSSGLAPAAVSVIAALPPHDRFLPIEESEPHVVVQPPLRKNLRQSQQEAGGRPTVIRADKLDIRLAQGVVVPRNHDDAVAVSLALRNDVLHRDRTERRLSREGDFFNQAFCFPQSGGDQSLLLAVRFRTWRAGTKSNDFRGPGKRSLSFAQPRNWRRFRATRHSNPEHAQDGYCSATHIQVSFQLSVVSFWLFAARAWTVQVGNIRTDVYPAWTRNVSLESETLRPVQSIERCRHQPLRLRINRGMSVQDSLPAIRMRPATPSRP